ncbi:hypothetical protein H072_1451 [Dactylellina haptotyla CBS 200.50]|uniref:Uncharacterized protein n=1 Tax=Dactylellina haptotyla (strain CBS 200.50) TaxID=1284197 RepID=S8ANY5_DACHA|nr:hypothetical protein H072_1451 [Dactylellina haptotyla CBS 200.50]
MDKGMSFSSAAKAGVTLKPVYKFVAFQDTTANVGAKVKGQAERIKSWQDPPSINEAWFDQNMVDSEIKKNPVGSYIQAYMEMGNQRRQVLDNFLKTLNDSDKNEAMVGPWEPVHLCPGTWIVDKRAGIRRPPKVFWVIIKRMKKSTPKPEDKYSSSSSIKGVLKDERNIYTSAGSSKSSPIKSETDALIQQLFQALTVANTSNNAPAMQAQLQQMQLQLQQLAQNQQRGPQTQQIPIYNALPQPPYTQQMAYQDQGQQINTRLSLPQAPMAPNSFHQYSSPDGSPIRMSANPHYPHTNYMPRDMYGQPRMPHEEEDEYLQNYHLNYPEGTSYPRGGAGSRRHSISSYGPGMSFQEEMHHHQKHSGGGGMYPSEMQHMLGNHPHLEPGKIKYLESWQRDAASSSDGSDEGSRGRPDSRADSIYLPNHLLNSRSRSLSRGGGVVDLSSAPINRRNSMSFSGGNMPSHMGSLGKGFGMSNSPSDDERAMGHHDRRVMAQNGMALPDRNMTRTPWGSRR